MTPIVRRRILGRTGLEISELSLGTVELGLEYGIGAAGERLKPSVEQAAALLHFALDHGINLIDTARAYGDSERIIGQTLGTRRQEYILLSKVREARPEEVRQQVEESLRELRTDVIDIMMIHSGSREIAPHADTTGELLRQRDRGTVRFVGSSVYGPEAAIAAIECGWFDCLEIAYNLLDRRPEAAVLEMAKQAGVGIVARSVLLKGALTARYRLLPDAAAPLKERVERLVEAAGSIAELPALAYRYVLGQEPPHTALVGTSSTSELAACMAYATAGPLTFEQVRMIQEVELDDYLWANSANWPALS